MSEPLTANPRNLGRCICVITGASRGFGRALALQVWRRLEPGSVLLLVARSGNLLEEVKAELPGVGGARGPAVRCVAADLATRDGVSDTVDAVRQEAVENLDHVLLVNNAASLGHISKFSTFRNPDEVNSYLALNVSSALALTAGILQAFPSAAGLRWSVVNCSSVSALQALPLWVLYCTAKAAREMMFRVLAKEEPHVKVLSYSPGPMDTDMQAEVQRMTSIRFHLHPCQESAAKLVEVLLDNAFTSGTHLDFSEM